MRRLALCLLLTACTQPEAPAEPEPVIAQVPLQQAVASEPTVVKSKESIPRDAFRYQRDLIRIMRAVWGLDAPVAVAGAQIQAESAWRTTAKSKFAFGLAQFTPATAAWISGAYPKELGTNDPGNPSWAIQALAIYDKRLFDSFTGRTECDQMSFALMGYNAGPGTVAKNKKLAKASGLNPETYFGSVDQIRDNRKPEYILESRNYVARILKTLQPLYVSWGRMVHC